MKASNPNCNGEHCVNITGEVRLLPLGKQPDHGNLILCRTCFNHEIAWRKQRNLELADSAAFSLPKWEDLKVYN